MRPSETQLDAKSLVDKFLKTHVPPSSWITIAGRPGVGKTALAQALMQATRSKLAFRFEWVFDLDGMATCCLRSCMFEQGLRAPPHDNDLDGGVGNATFRQRIASSAVVLYVLPCDRLHDPQEEEMLRAVAGLALPLMPADGPRLFVVLSKADMVEPEELRELVLEAKELVQRACGAATLRPGTFVHVHAASAHDWFLHTEAGNFEASHEALARPMGHLRTDLGIQIGHQHALQALMALDVLQQLSQAQLEINQAQVESDLAHPFQQMLEQGRALLGTAGSDHLAMEAWLDELQQAVCCAGPAEAMARNSTQRMLLLRESAMPGVQQLLNCLAERQAGQDTALLLQQLAAHTVDTLTSGLINAREVDCLKMEADEIVDVAMSEALRVWHRRPPCVAPMAQIPRAYCLPSSARKLPPPPGIIRALAQLPEEETEAIIAEILEAAPDWWPWLVGSALDRLESHLEASLRHHMAPALECCRDPKKLEELWKDCCSLALDKGLDEYANSVTRLMRACVQAQLDAFERPIFFALQALEDEQLEWVKEYRASKDSQMVRVFNVLHATTVRQAALSAMEDFRRLAAECAAKQCDGFGGRPVLVSAEMA